MNGGEWGMNKTDELRRIVSNTEVEFSGAVLVRDDQDTLLKEGYGQANRSEGIPNNVDTRFGMASGCKIFTSIAICQLAEKGVLDFQTRLKDCLDIQFPNFSEDITIHHLLTHTSGAPDYFDEEVTDDYEGIWNEKPMYSVQSPVDFVPLFQNEKMKFIPGTKFSYSNSGYIILGLIVEQTTGMAFTEYVENHIFKPCGMTDSGFFRMDQLPDRVALGYIDDKDGWKTNIYSVPVKGGPDGGAFSTVNDLEKFWNGLLNDKILSEKYRKILLTPHVNSNDNIFYGYGVWISMEQNDVLKYFVLGFDPGVRMHSSVNMKSKIQTHILSNIDQSVYPIVKEIDDLFQQIAK